MFIDPIKPINKINGFERTEVVENKKSDGMFASLVKNSINSMQETSLIASENIADTAMGLSDDPAQLLIDSTVANLTTSLVVQLRNKAVESYNEIIKMSV